MLASLIHALVRTLCLLGVLLVSHMAAAHETLPAALRVDEVSHDVYAVVWHLPATQGPAPGMQPLFPGKCRERGAHVTKALPGAHEERWVEQCTGGLLGQSVRIAGQENYLLDTVLRLSLLDGTVVSRVARARAPSVVLDLPTNNQTSAGGFFPLGVEHILGGLDHLLFVFCLLLWVRGLWPLLRTITGFTVGHSVTLTLASVGWVQLPGPPIEACIALSIVFLAATLARQSLSPARMPSHTRPWLLATVFGLLHGFGFASALAEVGLPQKGLALALLNFNLGVEAGQLLFVAMVLTALHLLRRLPVLKTGSKGWSSGAWQQLAVYGAGSVSVFWLLQRVALVVGLPVS